MPNQTEKLQAAFKQYEVEHDHEPTGTRPVVEWAVREGLLELPEMNPMDILAGKMAHALRVETAVDAQGRRYRVNHAVKIMKDGVQKTFWGIMGFAPHNHMQITFAQRREGIVSDCVKLKTDVDAYNSQATDEVDIQLELDFTDDVAEREISQLGDAA